MWEHFPIGTQHHEAAEPEGLHSAKWGNRTAMNRSSRFHPLAGNWWPGSQYAGLVSLAGQEALQCYPISHTDYSQGTNPDTRIKGSSKMSAKVPEHFCSDTT